jgi:hypothetical protein
VNDGSSHTNPAGSESGASGQGDTARGNSGRDSNGSLVLTTIDLGIEDAEPMDTAPDLLERPGNHSGSGSRASERGSRKGKAVSNKAPVAEFEIVVRDKTNGGAPAVKGGPGMGPQEFFAFAEKHGYRKAVREQMKMRGLNCFDELMDYVLSDDPRISAHFKVGILMELKDYQAPKPRAPAIGAGADIDEDGDKEVVFRVRKVGRDGETEVTVEENASKDA